MENYSKARTVEAPPVCPFSDLDAPQIRVKDGSKIRNLLRFALSRLEPRARAAVTGEPPPPEEGRAEEEAPPPAPCKHIVFTASGRGVAKAITCAEIVKRRLKGLHQVTRLQYSAAVDEWEPLEPGAGLDALTVRRNLPAIWILLSAEPLDPRQPGYQAPRQYDALWAGAAAADGPGAGVQRPGHRRKRGGAEGGGGARGRGQGTEPGAKGRGPARQAGRPRECC